MKHRENSRMYEAEEGKFVVRISDGKIMGDDICLGDFDSIDNYREEPYTKESRKEFFASIGMRDPKDLEGELNEGRMGRGRMNRTNRPASVESEQNLLKAVVESVSSTTAKPEKKVSTKRKTSKKRVVKTAKQEISK